MTPEEQFALEMEKRRAATEAVFRALDSDSHGPAQLNPVVADAIAQDAAPAVAETPAVTPAPLAEAPAATPVTPAVQPAPTASPVSFYDMILQNDAIRNKEKEDWDRREKSDKARTTIAAVTDALASLGNLVGTTQGAFSQPQTYQTPFITEQVERDRALARKRADMLYESDNAIRMAQAKYDQQLAYADRQLDVQREITERALKNNESKADIASMNIASKEKIAEMQDATKRYTTDENNKTKKEVADKNNESREKVAVIRKSGSGGGRGSGGSRGLTANANMKRIMDNASLAVRGELGEELRARGVKLPYNWEKDWKQYVSQAPGFYEKYFKNEGWEQLGGTSRNVATKEPNKVEVEQPESTQTEDWSAYKASNGGNKKEDWSKYRVR